MQLPSRVTTLGANQSVIEVHSVGVGDDPFAYAYQLTKRPRQRPVEAFRIEHCGNDYIISAQEMVNRFQHELTRM